MARRTIELNGDVWRVYPSGAVTQFSLDEFAVVFERGTGADRERRTCKYSPGVSRRPDAALAELSDERLKEFFAQSQPAWTSPQVNYTNSD